MEVENSPDATQFFQTTADALGRFETPAEFPKQLKYRLVVRSILKRWRCRPGSARRPAGIVSPTYWSSPRSSDSITTIPGNEAIALVDGRPTWLRISWNALSRALRPDGLSLLAADKGIKAGNVTEATYRSLQIDAFKKYAADYARTRMCPGLGGQSRRGPKSGR